MTTIAPLFDVAGFLPQRLKYYMSVPGAVITDRSLKPTLDALRTDGMTTLHGFLPDNTIQDFQDALPCLEAFRLSPEGTLGYFYPDADSISGLGPFYSDPRLEAIARGYVSSAAITFRRSAQWKVHHGPVETFEMVFHLDTWKHRLKMFLYLDDVDETNGAMVYLKGSHRGASWRLPHEAALAKSYRTSPESYAADTESAYLGCLWPHEVKQLQDRFGYRPHRCTGPAGTLLIFDARGLHRAMPLSSGQRRLLSSYWIVEGHHV